MYKRVHVAHHLIGVFDGDNFPDMSSGNWDNGLVMSFDTGAGIYTGISRGYARIAVEILEEPPTATASDHWEAVVEIDVTATSDALHVESFEWGAVDGLPILNPNGPGTYRLRAHAQGRDSAYDDAIDDESNERYLLQIWPQRAPSGSRVLTQRDSTSTHLLQAIEFDRQQGL